MTQTVVRQQFVRYSPEVERPDPQFDQALRTVLDATAQYVAGSVAAEGIGQAVRDAHAKAYGLVRGEVEILGNLPAEYAQGIYTKPGRHDALIRFSNGSPHTGADAQLGRGVGMGLKLFGISGPTLLEDEPNTRTFDYAMINNPTFFANSVEHYIFIQQLFLQVGTAPAAVSPAEARDRLHQLLYNYLTGMGTLPPEEWMWDELGVFLSLRHLQPINLLLSTYWTMGTVRHGNYLAKVRARPVQAYADQVVERMLDPAAATEVYRPALVAELRERPYEFDLQVQLCADLARMPVEDLTMEWPEALSPFITVAKLRLPRQDIGDGDNLARANALSLTPWRVTEAHRPLGNIMRARKEVYRQSSILRHQLNHQVRQEPKSLAEVCGAEIGA